MALLARYLTLNLSTSIKTIKQKYTRLPCYIVSASSNHSPSIGNNSIGGNGNSINNTIDSSKTNNTSTNERISFNHCTVFIDENCNKHTLEESERKRPYKRNRGVPKSLRIDVWNSYFGEDRGSAMCPVCRRKKITQLTFQCCHIVAHAKGGRTDLSNLIPGCDMCNQSMGTQNLYEFKKMYYPEYEQYFEDSGY